MVKAMRENKDVIVKVLWVACAVMLVPALVYAQAATGVTMPGTDQSGQLGAIADMGSTTVSFLLNTVAKVIGVGIAIWAVTDLVKRELVWGGVKLAVSGVCFFLPRIIQAIVNVGGGGTI
jgi:hypothetical protein